MNSHENSNLINIFVLLIDKVFSPSLSFKIFLFVFDFVGFKYDLGKCRVFFSFLFFLYFPCLVFFDLLRSVV